MTQLQGFGQAVECIPSLLIADRSPNLHSVVSGRIIAFSSIDYP